jgi:hypothetical protein
MTRANELREFAERKVQEASDLEKQYPGCRPGWVSCDIEMALHYAEVAEREADQLEGK